MEQGQGAARDVPGGIGVMLAQVASHEGGRTAAHALGRTLGWALTVTGKVAHIIGRILRAALWALGFLAFLSIVGYALGLGGNQQRHH